jgi:hypothetical protein
MEPKARQGYRVLAGVLSAGMLIIGLPACVYVALHDDKSGWGFAFVTLMGGVTFLAIAITGRMSFRKTRDDKDN